MIISLRIDVVTNKSLKRVKSVNAHRTLGNMLQNVPKIVAQKVNRNHFLFIFETYFPVCNGKYGIDFYTILMTQFLNTLWHLIDYKIKIQYIMSSENCSFNSSNSVRIRIQYPSRQYHVRKWHGFVKKKEFSNSIWNN